MSLFYLISLLFFIVILFMAWAGLSFAPWVPCRRKDLDRIFKLANISPNQTFYDLGCGDGKTVFYAAEKFKAKAIGLEISLPMFLICQIKKIWHPRSGINFKFKNLFKEDLSQADVVYFFGMPDTIKNKLQKKLKQEMKPGSKIISYAFSLPDFTPTVKDKPSPKDITIYLYQM